MLDFDKIELVNVSEIEQIENGYKLYRFPKNVIDNLYAPMFDKDNNIIKLDTCNVDSAQYQMDQEIRFYSNGDTITFTIKASDRGNKIYVYNGDLIRDEYFFFSNEERTITIKKNPAVLGYYKECENIFSTNVWRIRIYGERAPIIIDIASNGDMRKPAYNEKPNKTALIYGSSICMSCGTPYKNHGFIYRASLISGFDIINKSIAGGAYLEDTTESFLETFDVDFLILDIGINIADRPKWFIDEKIKNFIAKICTHFSSKKVFIITPFKLLQDLSSTGDLYHSDFEYTRNLIRNESKKYSNVIVIEGDEIMDKPYYLSADVLHPSDFGHDMMGVNLANIIKKYIK